MHCPLVANTNAGWSILVHITTCNLYLVFLTSPNIGSFNKIFKALSIINVVSCDFSFEIYLEIKILRITTPLTHRSKTRNVYFVDQKNNNGRKLLQFRQELNTSYLKEQASLGLFRTHECACCFSHIVNLVSW